MQQPDVKDYGDFYDADKQPTSEYERFNRDLARYATVSALAEGVVHALLAAESERVRQDDYASALRIEHRTHQQGLARQVRELLVALTSVLEGMAEMEYDDRNEGMVRFARAALEATKDIGLPLI